MAEQKSNIAILREQFRVLDKLNRYAGKSVGDAKLDDLKEFSDAIAPCWQAVGERFGKTKTYEGVPFDECDPSENYASTVIAMLGADHVPYDEFRLAVRHALRMEALAKELGGKWVHIAHLVGSSVEEIDQGGCSFDLGAKKLLKNVKGTFSDCFQLEKALRTLVKEDDETGDNCIDILNL